jgi:ATP-dependent RNA helicase DeaD
VETEEREERGSGRSQNVVHTLPRSMASVPRFLTGPLERMDPAAGVTQLVVVTADAETSVALAEAVLRMTGPAGIELIPVTSARRASRLMAGRPVLAVAGSPSDLRDLVRGSHLKLDGVTSVVLAWADEILSGDAEDIEALEAVMSELPKEAARIVVTSKSEGRVNAFAERYLRRAHRDLPVEETDTTPVPVHYVTVTATNRTTALRRLLDDLDPPSAAIVVSSDRAEAEAQETIKLLGYSNESSTVHVTRGEVAPSTYAVIFYQPPATRAELSAASAASPVTILSLAEAREVDELKRISGDAKPVALKAPANAAREKEVSMRRELAHALDAGIATREVLALEPLLEHYDGIEIAAAALRLLDRERALRHVAQAEARQAQAAPAREARPSFDRGAPSDRGSRGPSDRPHSGERKSFDRPRPSDRSDSRPPRKFDDRPPRSGDRRPDSRPPRDGGSGSRPAGNFTRGPRRDRT